MAEVIRGIERLFRKKEVKYERQKVRDLRRILIEMDSGKRIALATDIGGKLGGLWYIFPERQWVVDELKHSQEKLKEFESKLKKVV
jgi:hypothetical protein